MYKAPSFFIILSTKNLAPAGKNLGDKIVFELVEDPNPLGVDIPEVLEAVLAQDEDLLTIFKSLTLGKQRNVIHSVKKIKDVDMQIQRTIQLIYESTNPRPNGSNK